MMQKNAVASVFDLFAAGEDGSVVVNPDGTFVYTPSAQLAATGGTDVFTVKVEDRGFHFHGLLGLFQTDFGHSTTTTVAATRTVRSFHWVWCARSVGEKQRGFDWCEAQ